MAREQYTDLQHLGNQSFDGAGQQRTARILAKQVAHSHLVDERVFDIVVNLVGGPRRVRAGPTVVERCQHAHKRLYAHTHALSSTR